VKYDFIAVKNDFSAFMNRFLPCASAALRPITLPILLNGHPRCLLRRGVHVRTG
jgi:hypothetical protein